MQMLLSIMSLALLLCSIAEALTPQQFEERTELKGSYYEDEQVYKVSFPRTDIHVTIDQYRATPFMGLSTWAAFSKSKVQEDAYIAMGDFVLLQDEVNPVMSIFLEHGVKVTALHNHFFYDEPKIYYMHIMATNQLEKLGACIRRVMDEIQKIRKAHDIKNATFGSGEVATTSALDPKLLEKLLGIKGEAQAGSYKIVVGKKQPVTFDGCKMGKNMGVNSWAAFSGTQSKAIVDGDFALFEDELQPTLQLLRKRNINVVAIHNHMTHEEPRLFFVHYWGVGKVDELCSTIKEVMH